MRVHLSVLVLIVAIVASSILAVPHAYAAKGTNFDNVVVIAMENQDYASVMGTGAGSSNAPFIGTILNSGHSTTFPNYHSYGNGPGLPSISGCSAACYVAIVAGSTQGVSDGYCCITHPTLTDSLQTAGLSWQAYCESGCGRGPDHFPFYDATGALLPNTFAGSSVSTADFVTAANSATPPNFLWFTPTDSHNMHDNSIQTGDSYLQTFLVGSGSLSSPSSGSLLASSLFQPGHRTLLILWWDEYDPSPQLFYSPGLLSSSTIDNGNSYTEYSWLHMIENNWGLPTLTSNDAAAVVPAVFAGPQPFATSFTFTPSTPIVNLPVTFTSTTAGGQGPYMTAWNFGDGSTVSGLSATHTYKSTGSFTVSETSTDSSAPQKTTTASRLITVFSSITGNFGSCTSLPQGWNCGNIVSGAPSPTSAQIVNGVFQSRESNPGLGGSNQYYYSTTQKGTFPWTPCSAPATGVIPAGITSVSVNFTSLAYDPGSSPSADRYHIYIALYYWLPNGPVTSGGSTYQCLDTQSRVENVGGSFSPIGSTATYNPGDAFGWDNVTLQVSPGQTGLLVANVANLCLGDLQAWGIPTSIPCQLAGIEIGTEGYQFQELDVNWFDVSLNTGPVPPMTTFTVSTGTPLVNSPVTFTASTIGGAPPYMTSWDFGDGTTGSGSSVTHTFTIPGSFSVTETATDSSNPTKTVTSTQHVVVYTNLPVPPTLTVQANQTVIAGTWINFTVTGISVNSGGTITLSATGLPTGASFDSSTGAFSWRPSASQTGSYYIVFTATDSSDPSAPTSKTSEIQVSQAAPGGSNGGNGGSGGSSSGGCLFCSVVPKVGGTFTLLVVGGLLGLVFSLALLTFRARASLEQTKRRMRRLNRE